MSGFVREPVKTNSPSTPRRPPVSHCYTPSRSSPLSSHPQNAPQTRFNVKMLPSPPSSPPEFLAPKRLFKPIPTSHSHEEGREARRNLFLKKVRDAREEKLMKARGGEDEMMRLIFVSEQKRWEATQARTAASIPTIYEEEELDIGNEEVPDFQAEESLFMEEDGSIPSDDMDEMLDRDGKELEDLLSQLDLELDQVMPEASHQMMPT